jgi:hypothetical protein
MAVLSAEQLFGVSKMNGCKLSACPCDNVTLTPSLLKDGQIAVLTAGGTYGFTGYVGRVVQRVGSHLITVGKGSSARWSDISKATNAGIKVRALKAGECVQVC